MDGLIYAILAPEINRVKIGKTRNMKTLKSRLSIFRCSSPCELILHSIRPHNDFAQVEISIHRRFRKYHIRGEWFSTENEQVSGWLANRLEAGYGVKDNHKIRKINSKRRHNNQPKHRKLDDAIRFLGDYLKQSPDFEELARVITDVGIKKGFSLRTLQTAKKMLEIKSIKRYNEWWWSM
jgi:hypothetical protein